MNRTLLGKRIKEERIRSNLTQEQLAELIDVSTTYIGLVEHGKRSITLEKLITLASCLHVSIEDLLHDNIPNTQTANDIQMQSIWNQATSDEQSLILSLSKAVLNHTKKG